MSCARQSTALANGSLGSGDRYYAVPDKEKFGGGAFARVEGESGFDLQSKLRPTINGGPAGAEGDYTGGRANSGATDRASYALVAAGLLLIRRRQGIARRSRRGFPRGPDCWERPEG